MSQVNVSPPNDEASSPEDSAPPPAGPSTTSPPPDTAPEPQASRRGRPPARAATSSPRRRAQPSPPPARPQYTSPASSYCSAVPTIPPIGKWTVVGLRQALANSEVQFSRKLNKAELYDLYINLQSGYLSPKSTPAPKTANRQSKARKIQRPPRSIPPSSRTRSGSTQSSGRSNRPSASLGRAPDTSAVRPSPPLAEAQHFYSAPLAATPYAARPTGLPSASQPFLAVHNNPYYQWPPAPFADTSARMLATQAQTFHQFPPNVSNPAPSQWQAAQRAYLSDAVSIDLPSVAARALPVSFYPFILSLTGKAYPSDTVSLDLPSDAARALPISFLVDYPSSAGEAYPSVATSIGLLEPWSPFGCSESLPVDLQCLTSACLLARLTRPML
ncbi:hypothetical protein DPX16_23140 [Anabarilius grahami]|uniref:Uncharacterized protein n=1 Tax=Anabarilius grahami TaxID=495550 RepID=A0A3N0XIR6_ANAGA|nr:hypothetical protein DPX16_23140 [Anabarilius grahami]